MFLHDLAVGLLRRWYLVLFGLLVTGVGSYYLFQVVPVTYEATSSVVLVPPATAVIEGENPYLYMGGLDQALSVLTVRMSSPTVADPILHKRSDLNYTIGQDQNTAGPIMLVGAEAGTEEETLKVLGQVVKVIPENLKLLQDQLKIPKNARITAMTIVMDTTAEEVNKKQMRAVLAGGAAGMAITVLGTGLIDRMITRRRARRAHGAGGRARKTKLVATNETPETVDGANRESNPGEVPGELLRLRPGNRTESPRAALDRPEPSADGSNVASGKDDLISSSIEP